MEPTAADILGATYTYWVEINHGNGWTHIHHPDWETSDSYGDTMAYALTVHTDHPGEPVRIVERATGLPDVHIPVGVDG